MQIIKEYCAAVNKGVIRTNTYGHSLALMQQLFGEAQKSFPDLTADQVEIVQFGGRSYKRTYGIEFPINAEQTPEGYRPILRLENTM